MADASTQLRFFRRSALVWFLLLPILFYGLYAGMRGWLSTNLHASSSQTLTLYVAGLEELLSKYRVLPEIYAQHPTVRTMLEHPGDGDLRQRVNLLLQRYNTMSQAADTYVLDTNGLTLAASNWDQDVTFVGRNFNYRPYFLEAMSAGRGRFFALGTTSFQRGYYMSSAITNEQGATIGVMVVKVDVAAAETGWNAPDHEVIVTDRAGIVFLASRPAWLYNALGDPSREALAELGQNRRYADKKIGRLPFKISPAAHPWQATFSPVPHDGPSYLAAHQDINDDEWQVWILANTSPILNTALAYAGTIILVITFGVVAFVSLIERRRGLLRALSVQQRARQVLENSSQELERQVEMRTMDLKRTQNELVQAGKMAALGQMSVGINHELNQPLTAIRSYASNAGKLLDYGRLEEARENMTLISILSERMGDIILRLKIFARESSDERNAQVLQTVISDTMRIVEPRLKKDRVKLNIDVPGPDIRVLVNNVRLEQVLVNLINNAIDALGPPDSPHQSDRPRRIDLIAITDVQDAIVQVRDTGPGIPDDVISHLFEPFFTTKDVGLGLGLGLSISYGIIQEFGGELSAHNLPEGGAEFTFNIPLVQEGDASIALSKHDSAPQETP